LHSARSAWGINPMEIKEYSSLDQLLWTEADEVEFILYYSTDWESYDAVPVSNTVEWTKEKEGE